LKEKREKFSGKAKAEQHGHMERKGQRIMKRRQDAVIRLWKKTKKTKRHRHCGRMVTSQRPVRGNWGKLRRKTGRLRRFYETSEGNKVNDNKCQHFAV